MDAGNAGLAAHPSGAAAAVTVGVDRQWNSWDATDPLAMVHLPSGLCIRFSAFSSADGTYRLLGHGPGVTLLEHASDGRFIRARIAHAGSEMELTYLKPNPHTVLARLRTLSLGEWGLRFWLALEVGFLDLEGGPAPWRPDEPWIIVENPEPMPPSAPPRLIGRHRSLWASVASADAAVFGGAYGAIDTFQTDLGTRGYYAPPRAEPDARWGVLRFNAQMHPEINVVVALGTDRGTAERAADAALDEPAEWRLPVGDAAGDAVRDIIAWNTLWDVAHHRPTTVLTRNWLVGKFSGWGVWLNDMLFHALLAALVGDFPTARANLEAALEYQSPEGNLACLRTASQEWIDRSQSPIGAYVLWRIFEMTGDRGLLAEHFPTLLRAHRWWLAHRDSDGDGLMEYGSSPTGTGAFVHTKQAAMDESFMDNAPIFDAAGFDPETHTLTMAEPGLNSLLSLDAQCLAHIAKVLGEDAVAAELRTTAERLNESISTLLWDEARQVFAGRHRSGNFEPSLSVTCFYPLLVGAATETQANALVERYLLDPGKFWGERVVPSSAHDDPASADNVYWRGRIWPPHLFLVWEALRCHGRLDLAHEVANRAWRMFETGWAEARICRENFHRLEASGDDSPDSDRFYSWGALIPAMRMLDRADPARYPAWPSPSP
jgi:putative isomerase